MRKQIMTLVLTVGSSVLLGAQAVADKVIGSIV
jgi:hypothetical protein